ncbi:MAG: putative uroporphyrinogen methylase [Gammaproteobacteria bacterium]|jgi:uncharacterized protein YabN with tetrapyrrole methylase and pyrophosphatase domain|nr:putative uroporphyrinogen methylase [Gammaproteobacteria bacterium]
MAATASLVLIGTGIKTVSHLTLEACGYIRHADMVYYLVNDTLMQAWIQKEAKSSETLDGLYRQSPVRKENYKAITEYIIASLYQYKNLCVVFYGHPLVLATSTLAAVKEAENLGFNTIICPAVSAEDCLYADLKFDPGTVGCQSFEASDFIHSKRIFDRRSNLIIWQVGMIEVETQADTVDKATQQRGLKKLQVLLEQSYPPDHIVYLYVAALYPEQIPKITSLSLSNLEHASIITLSTLYIPPYNPIKY